ncbi:MAG: T9SS type A sorting domain-containing protein [Bacteroidetes bacterium]|nr:T9SS type A sorting domain-containing protein [Bacteroidota bacterium]
MKSKLLFAAVSVAFCLNVGIVHSQNINPCGTSELLEKQIKEHPELLKQMEEFQKYQADFAQKRAAAKTSSVAKYIIPVVFHVIHNYGAENISDAQINDAIAVINRDFQKLNADTATVQAEFKPLIANCQFEFRLAKKDPDGKCTNGIERIQSLQTYAGGSAAKLNAWPKEKYLNIWTAAVLKDRPGAAAYAQFPTSSDGFYGPLDGVMSLSDYVGSIGTSSAYKSRTLTHEIGHWLSLFHPWNSSGETAGVTCGDDGISDTPITKGFTTCPSITDICTIGIKENVENYMDYSYCGKMFTLGQQAAMEATLNSSVAGRSNLWTPANLAATGVDGSVTTTCAPIADFYSFGNYGCSGVNFLFYDVSWNGQVDNRTWTFSNATPSTSTLQNESVVFNTTGWQTVSLTVSNTNGSDTKTVTKQVFISDPVASQRTGTIVEDFENAAEFDSDWFVINQPVDINNSSSWQLTNTASHSGSKSIMLNSFFPSGYPNFPFSSGSGDVDEFITPSIDLTGVNPIYLNFWYSYATKAFKSADITESLKIYFSSNCGKNWTLDTTLSGASFLTGGSVSTSYVPNNASLWKIKSVLLSPSIAKGNIRFKFQYNSSPYSNNLYIDDINISADRKVGVIENENSVNSLSVYPNPANESATITYHIDQKQDVELSLYDILGNKVKTLVDQMQDDGDYAYKISKQSVAKGMYFIRLNIDNKNIAVKKFILLD